MKSFLATPPNFCSPGWWWSFPRCLRRRRNSSAWGCRSHTHSQTQWCNLLRIYQNCALGLHHLCLISKYFENHIKSATHLIKFLKVFIQFICYLLRCYPTWWWHNHLCRIWTVHERIRVRGAFRGELNQTNQCTNQGGSSLARYRSFPRNSNIQCRIRDCWQEKLSQWRVMFQIISISYKWELRFPLPWSTVKIINGLSFRKFIQVLQEVPALWLSVIKNKWSLLTSITQ